MTENQYYWSRKNEMKNRAVEHRMKMRQQYPAEIKNSIEHSVVYDDNNTRLFVLDDISPKAPEQVHFLPQTSVQGIFHHNGCDKKIAVLNFASYKNPGGMFLNGSIAQEESLCHSSTLFNVLDEVGRKTGYYAENKKNVNRSLYTNRAIYSPDIVFINEIGESMLCDVITCAAPNISSASKYNFVSPDDNLKALQSRINFVIDIASIQEVEVLVLGAYGCGVFGQNPRTVAELFKSALLGISHKIEIVTFAIPEDRQSKLEIFKHVWKNPAHDGCSLVEYPHEFDLK